MKISEDYRKSSIMRKAYNFLLTSKKTFKSLPTLGDFALLKEGLVLRRKTNYKKVSEFLRNNGFAVRSVWNGKIYCRIVSIPKS